jgi:hypothetical protein
MITNIHFSSTFKFVTDILFSNLKYKLDEIKDSEKLIADLIEYYKNNRNHIPPGYTPETAAIEAKKELLEIIKHN